MKTVMLGQQVEIKTPKGGKLLRAYINGELCKDIEPSIYKGVMLRRTKLELLRQIRNIQNNNT